MVDIFEELDDGEVVGGVSINLSCGKFKVTIPDITEFTDKDLHDASYLCFVLCKNFQEMKNDREKYFSSLLQ